MIGDWDTSCLDGNYPSQVGNVYDRPVCFPVCVCFFWFLLMALSGIEVLVLNHSRTASFSRQDS